MLGYILFVITYFLSLPNSGSSTNETVIKLNHDHHHHHHKRKKQTYEKVISCLLKSGHNDFLKDKNITSWKYPHDAEQHYQDLLNATAKFRNIPAHTWAGYSGPWIENHYIQHFMGKPLSYFSGMIPLFIQWTDIHVAGFTGSKNGHTAIPAHSEMPSLVAALLRDDVIYVTVVQDDQGFQQALTKRKPNILSISAGGYGHIPVPLIKGDIPYIEPPAYKNFTRDISFFGTRDRGTRGRMISEMETELKNVSTATTPISFFAGSTDMAQFIQEMSRTKFNLAPRGFGRTSFRLAEIIQLGRIPVYMYDDEQWFPYEGTNASVASFGYTIQLVHLHTSAVVTKIQTLNNDPVALMERLQEIKAIRSLYTYEGVIKQLELFFQNPFGNNISAETNNVSDGGLLRCAPLPINENRQRLM